MDTISWLVSLVRSLRSIYVLNLENLHQPLGFNFYISLESSEGSMWATGPLTVGGFGQDNCLAPGSM